MAHRYDDDFFHDVVRHIAQSVDGRYDIIQTNLQYASPGEIQWARTANEASLRASARIKPDRERDSDGVLINPFWYHWPVE